MLFSLYDVNADRVGAASDWTGKQPMLLADLIGGIGGAYRDRTDDPLLAKQMLSQLS